jgi:hypothetical protein
MWKIFITFLGGKNASNKVLLKKGLVYILTQLITQT